MVMLGAIDGSQGQTLHRTTTEAAVGMVRLCAEGDPSALPRSPLPRFDAALVTSLAEADAVLRPLAATDTDGLPAAAILNCLLGREVRYKGEGGGCEPLS